MRTYDPEREPAAEDWLTTEESERALLVTEYHRQKRLRAPNDRLHALMHVIVENQLALRIPEVVDALARLRGEGLTRHEAAHAVASVLAGYIYRTFKGEVVDRGAETHRPYLDRLKALTAESWRKSFEENDA